MRFPTEAVPAELPAMMQRMAVMVGWKTWQRRIQGLDAQRKANPLFDEFLLERYGLELAFARVYQHLRMTRRFPWPPRTAEEYRLYSFLAMAVHVHARLDSRGRGALAGAIRNGLRMEFGLGPLAFELRIAAQLMAQGFDVGFHDLDGEGGYDFLATSGRTSVEVECKHVSADIGRQIHRRKLYDLGGVLFPVTAGLIDRKYGGHLMEINIPGRLTSSVGQRNAILEAVRSSLEETTGRSENQACAVAIRPFALEASPFERHGVKDITMDTISTFLEEKRDICNSNALINFWPGHAAVVVHIRSMREDKVLTEILERLKGDAKRQFSGILPALLCVHLADLTREQLVEVADAQTRGTGIQQVISLLMRDRPHLHTVALMADGDVHHEVRRSPDGTQTSVREVGPSYVIRSPNHPQRDAPALNQLFGA